MSFVSKLDFVKEDFFLHEAMVHFDSGIIPVHAQLLVLH
jgi:hypothetical protein